MSTKSRPSRFRLWSRLASRYFREPQSPYGPGHMSHPAFVVITSSSRCPLKVVACTRPNCSSAAPYGGPWLLARSKCVTPRSNAVHMISEISSIGRSLPNPCHRPTEISGSNRPLRPHRRYGMSGVISVTCSQLRVVASNSGRCGALASSISSSIACVCSRSSRPCSVGSSRNACSAAWRCPSEQR